MAGERRYDDDEVREIFAEAARHDLAESRPAAAQGLTLAQLQEIGREAGLDARDVARAAAVQDARALQPAPRTMMGAPLEVMRIVPLPREPTSGEWEQLVAELRTTFRARGRVVSQGGLREWANGNLHACVEPGDGGYRLRLGTVKGNARTLNALGGVGLLAGVAALVSTLVSGDAAQAAIVPGMIAASGIGAFAANRLRLPRWADERRRQMEFIAARAGLIVSGEPRAAE